MTGRRVEPARDALGGTAIHDHRRGDEQGDPVPLQAALGIALREDVAQRSTRLVEGVLEGRQVKARVGTVSRGAAAHDGQHEDPLVVRHLPRAAGEGERPVRRRQALELERQDPERESARRKAFRERGPDRRRDRRCILVRSAGHQKLDRIHGASLRPAPRRGGGVAQAAQRLEQSARRGHAAEHDASVGQLEAGHAVARVDARRVRLRNARAVPPRDVCAERQGPPVGIRRRHPASDAI